MTMLFVYKSHGATGLKHTSLFGMLSLLPYFAFLLSVFLLADRGLYISLSVGLVAWFLFALLIVKLSGAI
jgi:membrane protein GlpM